MNYLWFETGHDPLKNTIINTSIGAEATTGFEWKPTPFLKHVVSVFNLRDI